MKREIWIVQRGNQVGYYKPGTCPSYGTAPAKKFKDLVESLREDYPGFRLRCIKDKKIEGFLLNYSLVQLKQGGRE